MGATDISEPTEWSWGWSSLGGEETPGQRRKSNLSRSSFCAANCQSFEKTTQTKKKAPKDFAVGQELCAAEVCIAHQAGFSDAAAFWGELHQIGLRSAWGQAGAEAPGPFRLEHGLRAGSSHKGQEK